MTLTRYTPSSFAPALRYGRSPWTGFESELDRLFESALGDSGYAGETVARRFPVDLYEDADNLYVRAELPGVKREDVTVELAEGYLTLTAVRKVSGDPGETSASLSRSLAVSDSVDTAKVNAELKDGILTVTLPKREESKPRKINVTVS